MRKYLSVMIATLAILVVGFTPVADIDFEAGMMAEVECVGVEYTYFAGCQSWCALKSECTDGEDTWFIYTCVQSQFC